MPPIQITGPIRAGETQEKPTEQRRTMDRRPANNRNNESLNHVSRTIRRCVAGPDWCASLVAASGLLAATSPASSTTYGPALSWTQCTVAEHKGALYKRTVQVHAQADRRLHRPFCRSSVSLEPSYAFVNIADDKRICYANSRYLLQLARRTASHCADFDRPHCGSAHLRRPVNIRRLTVAIMPDLPLRASSATYDKVRSHLL